MSDTTKEDEHNKNYVITLGHDLQTLELDAWNKCALGNADQPEYLNPFIDHRFLATLEHSGCVSAETGWLPQHILIHKGDKLVAALPCYLKNHSMGEYVFDYGWADAFERAGGAYYPKLQCSVPFTPATGPRLLVHRDADRNKLQTMLLRALQSVCEQLQVSSAHITFMPEEEYDLAGEAHFLQRNDQQFHWQNQAYQSFDDFLASLVSRKRKTIKRERREAQDSGLGIEWLTGNDICERHWDAFFSFYMDTGSRKWGTPYLNRSFFSMIHAAMPENIALCMAKSGDEYIAGALNFYNQDTLYGRYWGALEYQPFLHFELCYYQAIEFAIERGLRFVEAGAQGPHKLARGYRPVATYSAHWVTHPGLRRAIDSFLEMERKEVEAGISFLETQTPFRKKSTNLK